LSLKAGDICIVTYSGALYSSFREFAESNGYPDAVLDDHLEEDLQEDFIQARGVKILFIDSKITYDTIAIVEMLVEPHYQFVIGVGGLSGGEDDEEDDIDEINWQKLIVEVKGKATRDLVIALKEVIEKVNNGYTSGNHSNNSGNYVFSIDD
jgi:hypothetical protein